ncbi:MAG: tetratricopeptide repeat protein [Anaerolineales bacterium]
MLIGIQPTTAAPESSLDELRAAVAAAEAGGDLAALNVALGTLGRGLLHDNQALPALTCFEKGLKVAQQLNDVEAGARHLANQGIALAQIGNFSLAIRAFRKAYGFAQKLQHDGLIYDIVLHLAELEQARESPESALGLLDEALRLAERNHSEVRQLQVRLLMGGVYQQLEDAEQAEEQYAAALHVATALADGRAQVDCLQHLGALARSRRNQAQAAAYFQRALDLPDTEVGPHVLLALLAQLGDARFALGELPAAQGAFEAALSGARQVGDQAAETRLLGSLGLCAAEQGDPAAALNWANQAVGLARQLEDQLLLGEQLLFQAMALHDSDQLPTAQQACDEALALFERLEASSLVQKAYELRDRIAESGAA